MENRAQLAYNNGMHKKNICKLNRNILALGTFVVLSSCVFSSSSPNNYVESRNINYRENLVLKAEEVTKPNLSFSITTACSTDTSTSFVIEFAVNNEKSFYLGYGSAEKDIKAKLVYQVKTKSGKIEEREADINRKNKNGFYDVIGEIGSTSFSSNVDVFFEIGEEVLTNGFKVRDIVEAEKGENGKYSPKKNVDGSIAFEECDDCNLSNLKSYKLSEFLELSYAGSSSFGNYASFQLLGEGHGAEIYQNLGTKYKRAYKNHADYIESGKAWIRTRLLFDNETIFEFKVADETIYKNAFSQMVDITSANSKIGLLYDGIDINKVENIKIYNFIVCLDVFLHVNSAGKKIDKSAPNSSFQARFNTYDVAINGLKNSEGEIVREGNKNAYKISSTLIVLLSVLLSALAYCGVTLGIFFYEKKAFKDDEFKRVRPKEFFKTAGMGLITIESLILAIESITLRSTTLLTSFKVYNEIDVYIVVSSIASIIFVGYFIKYFITMFKNNAERRRNEKLNSSVKYLNEDLFTLTDD